MIRNSACFVLYLCIYEVRKCVPHLSTLSRVETKQGVRINGRILQRRHVWSSILSLIRPPSPPPRALSFPLSCPSSSPRLTPRPSLYPYPSLNVLKVGFNAGHSSLNWLLNSHPSTKVLAFDLGEHNYAKHALHFLRVISWRLRKGFSFAQPKGSIA